MTLRLGTFVSDVRSVVLTGLSTASSAVLAATDTVLVALGKLQAQINLLAPKASPSFSGTIAGTADFSSVLAKATSGTTNRSLAVRFADVANVKDFGAKGDGVTDDTAAFTAAIAASNFVLVPYSPTPYVVGTVTANRSVTISGQGGPNGQATLQPLTLTTTVFDVAAEWVTIENLAFSTSSPGTIKQTAGTYINVRVGANRFRAHQLTLSEWHEGITVQGSATVTITEVRALLYSQGVSQSSAAVAVHGGTDIRIVGLLVNGPNATQTDCLTGVQVDAVGDMVIGYSQIIGCGTDLLVNPGNGQVVASLWAIGTFFDTAYRGCDLTPTGTGQIVRTRLADCWFSSQTTNGIRISSGTQGVDIDNPHVFLNGSNGIANLGGAHVRVRGGQIAQNGDNGYFVDSNVSHWSIEGATIGPCAGLSSNTNYAVFVNAGTSDYYRVVGNIVDGNGAGGISDAGSGRNKDVFGNPGDVNAYNMFRDAATGFLKFNGKQIAFSGYLFNTDDNIERMRITSAGVTVGGSISTADLNVAGTGAIAGAWASTTGTVGALSGTLGSGNTGTIRYRKIGRTVHLNAIVAMGASGQGTGAVGITLGLPWTVSADSVIAGREVTIGKGLIGTIGSGGNTLNIQNYDSSYPAANSYRLVLSGTIEVTA